MPDKNPTPAEKRLQALNHLMTTVMPASSSYQLVITNPMILAEEIRKLAPLGKTHRWTEAIEAWATAVEDPKHDLQWAFTQYGIFAGHAAS